MSERIIKGCDQVFEGVKYNNIKEIINNAKENFGCYVAFKLRNAETKEIYTISYDDYIDEVNALGTALISIGLKGKKIAIISENRYEWEEAYLAIAGGTGTAVLIDSQLPNDDILSLIEKSEIEAIFYSSKCEEIIEKIRKEKSEKVKFFISMDLEEKTNEAHSQRELIKLGKDLIKNGARSFLDSEVNNDDEAMTFFTTEEKDTVTLSQKNMCTNLNDISSIFNINEDDLFLSFLPLNNISEFIMGFLYPISVGAGISFSEKANQISEEIKELQVTAMISTSDIYENIYEEIMKKAEESKTLKSLKFKMKLTAIFKKMSWLDLRRKVFKEILKQFGGKIRLFISINSLEQETEKGLNELGINTYQMYALEEKGLIVSTEHETCVRYGSRGKILPSLRARIIEPNDMGIGKIAIKFSNRMQEENDWILSKDLGYFDKDNYLFMNK